MKPEDARFDADEVKYGPEAAARIRALRGDISAIRAYALKQARALRVLRSVKSQGQADAYQDMANRLIDAEKVSAL